MVKLATDPPVSEAQRRAMYAARAGKSTLGIPKKVGEEFVGKDSLPIAAGIVLVAADGDVLLLRRASTEKNYGGYWGLPGGKAEAGENDVSAALREANEELGVCIEDEGLRRIDKVLTPNGMIFTTFTKPVPDKFVPKLDGEHSGYCWASLDMLPKPLHPSVERVLGEHIGVAADMQPDDWECLRNGFAKWSREEENEPAHTANDQRIAMDRASGDVYDRRGRRMPKADILALDRAPSVRTYDADGQLHVSRTPISKANICEYYGHEIPLPYYVGDVLQLNDDGSPKELEPQRKYKLLRHPDELRKAASSSNGKQLMMEHVPVSADDPQKDDQVGSTGTDGEFEHPFLYNSLHVHDRKGIDGIESGKQRELSSAYRYKLNLTPGLYENEPFDGSMFDIDFNHVCLVPAGRAGADVLVMDGAINLTKGELPMIKSVLSRKGTYLAGACAAYLSQRLAKDRKLTLDLAPLFVGVTNDNFSSKKAGIVSAIQTACGTLKTSGAMAADAELDHFPELLEHLGKSEVKEGADMEPNSAVPMTKDEMEKKAKDAAEEEAKKKEASDKKARDKKAKDRKRARDAAIEKWKEGKDEAACKGMDELMGELDGMDGEAEEATENEEGKGGKDEEPKVSKSAMDAAIREATAKATSDTLKTANRIAEAREFVFDWVGKLAMDAVAPADVYKTALDALGVDVAGVDPSAFRKILEVQPKPGASSRQTALASDATPADTAGFSKRWGNALDNIIVT